MRAATGVALLAGVPWLANPGSAGGEGFRWLERAEVEVVFSREGKHRLAERLWVGPRVSGTGARLEHSLFLDSGTSITSARARSSVGNPQVELTSEGALTRLWVVWSGAVPEHYELELEVDARASPFRCPIPVPSLPPRDPHDSVILRVLLPSGQELSGFPFPYLRGNGPRLTARMGGVPSFVLVPRVDRLSFSWFSRHGTDLLVLLLLGGGSGIWFHLWRSVR